MNIFSRFSAVPLAVITVAVILLLSVTLGVSKGKSASQSAAVLKNAEEVTRGLEYFYNDQNRYPTATEMSSVSLMLNYFTAFPPSDIVTGNCAQTFSYKRPSKTAYELSFCLPAGSEGFKAGWNAVTQAK